MACRREEGLCFNCPAKFSREHLKKCTMRSIYLLEVDGETTPGDGDSDDVQICSNAITDIETASMKHLDITVAGVLLRALVDLGLTHCFIATSVARLLGLVPSPRPGMTVGVANGDPVPYEDVCHAVPVDISSEHFVIDFFVTPLYGYALVLGCHWLRTLGLIIWDLNTLDMSFWRVDHRIH